jgi:hypothetical protein
MEALNRLVADSLARHGLNRPVDPRRLQWSRWFRCDSPHSLLVVPSKPGIFALAEEITDLGASSNLVGTAAPGCPAEQSSAAASSVSTLAASTDREGHDFSFEPALSKRSAPQGAVSSVRNTSASAAKGIIDGNQRAECVRRMLAVLQFSEDDDMAYVLDRMFTRINPMRARLASGRCFLRFVGIEDQDQRRSICTALNQWLVSSAEKASGISTDFASSLELNVAQTPSSAFADSPSVRVGRTLLSDSANSTPTRAGSSQPVWGTNMAAIPRDLDSGAHKNLHCPNPFPSGF